MEADPGRSAEAGTSPKAKHSAASEARKASRSEAASAAEPKGKPEAGSKATSKPKASAGSKARAASKTGASSKATSKPKASAGSKARAASKTRASSKARTTSKASASSKARTTSKTRATAGSKSGRGKTRRAKGKGEARISEEARAKANETRRKRSIFNRYLQSTPSARVEGWRARLQEVEALLDAGVRARVVPKFVDGKRVGTEVKDVPLQPADRAKYLARRQELRARIESSSGERLRARFLEILPSYAASQGWDRELLLEVGVSEDDLEGIS